MAYASSAVSDTAVQAYCCTVNQFDGFAVAHAGCGLEVTM